MPFPHKKTKELCQQTCEQKEKHHKPIPKKFGNNPQRPLKGLSNHEYSRPTNSLNNSQKTLDLSPVSIIPKRGYPKISAQYGHP